MKRSQVLGRRGPRTRRLAQPPPWPLRKGYATRKLPVGATIGGYSTSAGAMRAKRRMERWERRAIRREASADFGSCPTHILENYKIAKYQLGF